MLAPSCRRPITVPEYAANFAIYARYLDAIPCDIRMMVPCGELTVLSIIVACQDHPARTPHPKDVSWP
jgi:hypothetical protein